jgi:hypothetical protein
MEDYEDEDYDAIEDESTNPFSLDSSLNTVLQTCVIPVTQQFAVMILPALAFCLTLRLLLLIDFGKTQYKI